MSERGYREIDHTADLALEIRAPSEEELFEEGGQAIIRYLTEGADIRSDTTREFSLEAFDREDRLVVWLNEVLVCAVTRGFLFHSFSEIALTDGRLDAVATGEGEGISKITSELKSVTYHDLEIREEDDLFAARVVIDV